MTFEVFPPLDPSIERIYAVGDIHGRLDLLTRAVTEIDRDLAGRPGLIVTLGDYVDRGPESAGVVALLRRLHSSGEAICIRGNHEALMAKAVRTGDTDRWYRNGGEATVASYGGTIIEDDIAWMEGLPVFWSDRQRLYVHGGVAPNVSLAEQDEETCMWIRNPFLEAEPGDLPAHVVHGHTPRWAGKPEREQTELLAHRTNLDTAAYRTGRLAVGVFNARGSGGPLKLIEVVGAPVEYEEDD